MSGRAAAALVLAAAGAGAAWWYVQQRQLAHSQGIAADNFGFLDDGSGIFAPTEQSSAAGSVGELWASATDSAVDWFDSAMQTVGINLNSGRWLTVIQRPENATLYQSLLSAELDNGIPSHMLVRLCYQESKYDPQAYNSKVGATGIMQIVPKWHPGVDATNPAASITYAGKFLSSLFNQFGNWENALQAYNWGAANLKKYLATGAPPIPRETSNYSRMILADVGNAGGGLA